MEKAHNLIQKLPIEKKKDFLKYVYMWKNVQKIPPF